MEVNPQCVYCKYLTKDAKCEAFKNGIPEDILYNKHDHTEPYKGDNGIQFKPVNSEEGTL